ncbi:Uncharacterised protein [Campylobacter sputorum subsp. bubulus]|uniref:Uncharacterized protein n=1 Tax=Campylobacter sputorum subsp. sputorum TaxID=32024 RepID=A0A381DKG4_9BACT|nr:hypothetical protein [Campylobacter sputorum]ASM34522.1 hypothetical protein CSPUT_0262 [Campylobacter sputorum aubsp. sputorum RM3237]ASM34575.1 hypothetical protein CSPUT_0316 [Campylobacter sputorum aubsp. sputorum RM3237]KAB0579980.1 hypothetical protein F7P64_08925 [Campylobacter sputorum subsp. sputorum]QEL04712.1 hypothetical protein CSPT_0262 [Campylobacter sputorum subsp. sputorum]QEL04765.1 hypothetical protein CSPT_0316 [Campylobacter sputorum subsp. sputorum]
MIGSINGFESNLSYYNTNTTTNLKENSVKEQLTRDNSNIKEQTTQEQTINQTNENKLEENTKDIITKIKEKQKTQSKEEMAKQNARFRNYFYNKSDYDILGEFVKFDRNEVDWKEKSIVQLEELLNKKYTKEEQEYIFNISIFDIETIGDADLLVDNNLVT